MSIVKTMMIEGVYDPITGRITATFTPEVFKKCAGRTYHIKSVSDLEPFSDNPLRKSISISFVDHLTIKNCEE